MGYFSNMTEWECWAASNCFRCAHWPKDDDAPGCPVELAHTLYSYDLCNDSDHPGKVILDMLIPRTKGEAGNRKCAMFQPRNGVTDKHLRDWERYKAAMAEAAGSASGERAREIGTRCKLCRTFAPEAFADECNRPECPHRTSLTNPINDHSQCGPENIGICRHGSLSCPALTKEPQDHD